MDIHGLGDNYYLTQNNIWVNIFGMPDNTKVVEIKATNMDKIGVVEPIVVKLRPFEKSFGTQAIKMVSFNVCQIVRALFVEYAKINDAMEEIRFEIKCRDTVGGVIEEQTVDRYFLRGGVWADKDKEWHLNNYDYLIVGKWIEWEGVLFNNHPLQINNGELQETNGWIPEKYLFHKRVLKGCDYKIIMWLNSLGGLQYFVFPRYEIETKTKGSKSIGKINGGLEEADFINSRNEVERTITVFDKTPAEIQDVIVDLIQSNVVYMGEGVIDNSGFIDPKDWKLLKIVSNKAVKNNYTQVYDNEIKFRIGY